MKEPYYDDGVCTIYHGDAKELLPQLPADSVEMVCADPPYFRVLDAEWDDQWGPNPATFLGWLGEFLDHARRVLHERGTLAVFCWPDMACGVETEVRRRFAFLNHVVWRKDHPGWLGRMSKGEMRRFFNASERIILAEQCRNPDGDLFRFRDHVNHAVARDVYADIRNRLVGLRDAAGLSNRDVDEALGRNGMAGHYFGASQWMLPTLEAWTTIAGLMRDRGVADIPTWESLRQEFDARRREFDAPNGSRHWELLSDVWTFKPELRRPRHPAQKPEPLIEHMVGTMTRRGDTILDPFLGSGTTLAVARNVGRKAIGIEIEERYCEIAAKRLAQEVLALA